MAVTVEALAVEEAVVLHKEDLRIRGRPGLAMDSK